MLSSGLYLRMLSVVAVVATLSFCPLPASAHTVYHHSSSGTNCGGSLLATVGPYDTSCVNYGVESTKWGPTQWSTCSSNCGFGGTAVCGLCLKYTSGQTFRKYTCNATHVDFKYCSDDACADSGCTVVSTYSVAASSNEPSTACPGGSTSSHVVLSNCSYFIYNTFASPTCSPTNLKQRTILPCGCHDNVNVICDGPQSATTSTAMPSTTTPAPMVVVPIAPVATVGTPAPPPVAPIATVGTPAPVVVAGTGLVKATTTSSASSTTTTDTAPGFATFAPGMTNITVAGSPVPLGSGAVSSSLQSTFVPFFLLALLSMVLLHP